ncbi:MAG: twin-arginine translocase TatA/TatE family subunit [Phycisphaerales bacterium]
MHTLATFLGLGLWESLAILALGLLLFGRRLPEVGKSLGRSIVEFRKGLSGIEREVEEASHRPPSTGESVRAPLTEGEDVRVSRAPGRVAAEGQSGSAS